MNNYDIAIFDLDGTLTDSGPGIMRSAMYALEKFGIKEPDFAKLKAFVGPPLTASFHDLYGIEGEDLKRAVAWFRERYHVTGVYENSVYEGIVPALDRMKEAGVLTGVASSKPHPMVEQVLGFFNLASRFDAVLGSDPEYENTNRVVKSDKSEILGTVLNKLREKSGRGQAARAVMIGDRENDIRAAADHGIDSIGVLYGYAAEGELESAGAKYLVKTAEELASLVTTGGK